jgi:hypothetical protein
MGQARSRGTREERRDQAVERDRLRREALEAAEMARWEALTDEQRGDERERKRQAHRRVAELMAIAGIASRGVR